MSQQNNKRCYNDGKGDTKTLQQKNRKHYNIKIGYLKISL